MRDAGLTEAEFRQLCGVIARCGQLTTTSHNEVVLAAGSLGVSALVCMLNNREATTANLMGPFWRDGSPVMNNGESILRSATPGEPVQVSAWVRDVQGRPVAGAEVDVWQASGEGFYENQDPGPELVVLRRREQDDA